MKELNIFELRFGFYIKTYLHGQSPRPKVDHLGQNIRKVMCHINFRILQQSFSFLFRRSWRIWGAPGCLLESCPSTMMPLRLHGVELGPKALRGFVFRLHYKNE